MKCPYCSDLNNKVIDSRLGKDAQSIRRRRECIKCDRRFTTYEKIEEQVPLLIKKDGRREAFSRDKIRNGILKATEKRPVSITIVEDFIDTVERQFTEANHKDISARSIGEKVMEFLKETDPIAYVRFASVYHSFTTLDDFDHQLRELAPTLGEATKFEIRFKQ